MNQASNLFANASRVPAHECAWTPGAVVGGLGGAGIGSAVDSILQ